LAWLADGPPSPSSVGLDAPATRYNMEIIENHAEKVYYLA